LIDIIDIAAYDFKNKTTQHFECCVANFAAKIENLVWIYLSDYTTSRNLNLSDTY